MARNTPFPAGFAVFATAAGPRCTARPRSGASATVQRAEQFARDDPSDHRAQQLDQNRRSRRSKHAKTQRKFSAFFA